MKLTLIILMATALAASSIYQHRQNGEAHAKLAALEELLRVQASKQEEEANDSVEMEDRMEKLVMVMHELQDLASRRIDEKLSSQMRESTQNLGSTIDEKMARHEKLFHWRDDSDREYVEALRLIQEKESEDMLKKIEALEDKVDAFETRMARVIMER